MASKPSPLDFRYDPNTGQPQAVNYGADGPGPANATGNVAGGAGNGAINPLARQLYDRQLGQLEDFRANRNKYSDELYNSAASSARRNLTSGIKKARDSYNSRGLLNSGMRVGAEEGLRSGTAADLAAKRQSINQGLLSQQEGMESNVFGAAGGLAAPGVDIANPYLSGMAQQMGIDTETQARNQESMGQAFGGVGALGGALAGTMFNQKKYGYGGSAGSGAGNYGEMGNMSAMGGRAY